MRRPGERPSSTSSSPTTTTAAFSARRSRAPAPRLTTESTWSPSTTARPTTRVRSWRGSADRVDVVLKEQGGQASALNAGLERCQGDILHAPGRRRRAAARSGAAAWPRRSPPTRALQGAVPDGGHRRRRAGRPARPSRSPHLQRAGRRHARGPSSPSPSTSPGCRAAGTAFRIETLRRILPIPEADYPRSGADWYLVHLSALLGAAAALDDVCAEYRAHGANAYELGPRGPRPRPRPRLDRASPSATTAPPRPARGRARPRAPGADPLDLRPREPAGLGEARARPAPARRRPARCALLADAVRAARRRFDVAWPMKAMFVCLVRC